MQNKKFNIIIPVYKELSECDKFSLRSLVRTTLQQGDLKYPVYVICPKKELESIYKNFNEFLYSEFNISIIKNRFITFADHYFESTDTYSTLLLESGFYQCFLNLGFEYSYIFQLDCYLFRDELQYWVNVGYDFVGSPILATNSDWGPNLDQLDYVGNGGFSLRNNRTLSRVLDQEGPYKEIYQKYKDILFYKTLPKNSHKRYIDFEDIYICQLLSRYFKIKIPRASVAAHFALDRNPWVAQDKYEVDLPMCCHNWILFCKHWVQYIDELKADKSVYNYCINYIELFQKAYHPELEGYGN